MARLATVLGIALAVAAAGCLTPDGYYRPDASGGDGKELFYRTPGADPEVAAAEVSGEGATFTVGKVERLFRAPGVEDVAPDGTRFIAIINPDQKNAAQSITLVTNWLALLTKR